MIRRIATDASGRYAVTASDDKTARVWEVATGKADHSGSSRITHKGLDYYLSERVKALTNGQQHPVTQAPGSVPDFPLAVTRR